MINKTKGELVDDFIECSKALDFANKQVEIFVAKREQLENLIAHDNEICDLIAEGGISTLTGELLVLDQTTNSLKIKKVTHSYSIKSELTDNQLKDLENGK